MKTATDPRHRHRIELVQKLFSSQFQNQADSSVKDIWSNLDKIDPLISKIAPEWPIDKLNPIDLAILRLSIYELIIDKNAPYKVIIDEAVEIAKEYGGEGSPAFVNGALGHLVQLENITE